MTSLRKKKLIYVFYDYKSNISSLQEIHKTQYASSKNNMMSHMTIISLLQLENQHE